MKEAERLSSIWGCVDEQPALFQGSQEDFDAPPDTAADELRQAISTFQKKSVGTWDGLHPKHFALLSDSRLETMTGLLT